MDLRSVHKRFTLIFLAVLAFVIFVLPYLYNEYFYPFLHSSQTNSQN